jgi:hypothetical protein
MSFIAVMKKVIVIQFFLLLLASNAPALSIFAHYMPWFQTQGRSGSWTHWGDTIPNQTSHFTPIIGLYDSRDPDVQEYQVLLMKYAGLDGLCMDWYGINNGLPEYGTQPIFAVAAKAGLKFAMVWEDRYMNNQGGPTPVLQFMESNFFNTSNYLKVNNQPILLVWQITDTNGTQWQNNLNAVTFKNKPILITRDNMLAPGAQGAFSWINAPGGTAKAIASLQGFLGNTFPYMIPTAFPRFVDDYPGFSYGTIDDQNGQMFINTISDCISSGNPIIQIATWNDWQEGTIIEPSTQYQYRDLIEIQTLRKKYIDPNFSYTPANMWLADSIFRQRRKFRGNTKEYARVDSAANAMYAGNPTLAYNILEKITSSVRVASRAPVADVKAGTMVYDIQGRMVRSFDLRPHSNAADYKSALSTGVYILKRDNGAVPERCVISSR